MYNVLYFDNDGNLPGFRSIFRRLFNVLIYSDLQHVKSAFCENEIAVAIFDYHVTNEKVVDVINDCRKQNTNTVFLVISALENIDSVVNLINHEDIYGFIRKPWSFETVKLILRNAVEVYQTRKDKQKLIEELTLRNRQLSVAIEKEKQASALKELFLKNLSHEIRTPLNAIMGFNQLIAMSCPTQQLKVYSEKSVSAGYFLLSSIENMIEASKIVNNEIVYNKERVNLSDAVSSICHAWMDSVNSHKVIRVNAEKAHYGYADIKYLKKVLNILLNNAHELAPGIPISVTVRNRMESVIIDIEDKGPGIPPDDIATIFEPFNKTSGASGNRKSGLGISLFIARSHIENFGGKIEVCSENGRGTTFSIILPIT